MPNVVYDIASRANLRGFQDAESALDSVIEMLHQYEAESERGASKVAQANRRQVQSISSVRGALGGLVMGMVGGAGVVAAVETYEFAVRKLREELKLQYNEMRFGVRDVEAYRDAVKGVFDIDVKAPKIELKSVSDLKTIIVSVRQQLEALKKEESGTVSAILDPFSGAAGGRPLPQIRADITAYREQLRLLEENLRAVELQTKLVAEASMTATQSDAFMDAQGRLNKPDEKPDEDSGERLRTRLTLMEELQAQYDELLLTEQDITAVGAEAIAIVEARIEKKKAEIAVTLQLGRMARDGNPIDQDTVIPGLTGPAILAGDAALERQRAQMEQHLAQLKEHQQNVKAASSEAQDEADLFAQQMASILRGGLADLVTVAGQGNGALLATLGATAESAGRYMIVAAKAFESFAAKLLFSPPVAIATGVALVAFGRALKRRAGETLASFGGEGGSGGPSVFIPTGGDRQPIVGTDASVYGQSTSTAIERLAGAVERLQRDGLRGTLTSERGAFKAELVSQNIRDEVNDVRFYHGGA